MCGEQPEQKMNDALFLVVFKINLLLWLGYAVAFCGMLFGMMMLAIYFKGLSSWYYGLVLLAPMLTAVLYLPVLRCLCIFHNKIYR